MRPLWNAVKMLAPLTIQDPKSLAGEGVFELGPVTVIGEAGGSIGGIARAAPSLGHSSQVDLTEE
jgi:hypothetical protein